MIGLLLSMLIQPPLLIVVEQPAVVYGPDGQRTYIPAGAEIEACEDELGAVMYYEHDPVVVRIPAPCKEKPLFSDSFE